MTPHLHSQKQPGRRNVVYQHSLSAPASWNALTILLLQQPFIDHKIDVGGNGGKGQIKPVGYICTGYGTELIDGFPYGALVRDLDPREVVSYF